MESFINEALPHIDCETIVTLKQRLKEVGVDCIQDLQFVEEKYIEDILRPIDVKKFLLNINKNMPMPINVTLQQDANGILQTITDVTNIQCTSHTQSMQLKLVPPIDWATDFDIPWEMFPHKLLLACEQKTPAKKRDVCEMIRILTEKIAKSDLSPGRKNLRVIAGKVVSKYPHTFQDRWGDTIVDGGCTTIMKRLENCLDNKKRFRAMNESFCAGEVTILKKKKTRDSYGCVNWQPKDLPGNETKLSQLEKRQWLIEEYPKQNKDTVKVLDFMTVTYASQRFAINNGLSPVTSIQAYWPFLFEENYLIKHCEYLLEKNMQTLLGDSMTAKCKIIYKFMKTKATVPILKLLEEIDHAKMESQSVTPEYIGIFPLLMEYFGEEVENLFKTHMQPICEKDLESQTTVITPFIATLGCSIYTSKEFALVIDGKVTTYVKSFRSAIAVLFSSYYVFNIEYPKDACVTMEFIQRCFMDINPERGSKVPKEESKKKVSRKILNLLEELKNFETIFKI